MCSTNINLEVSSVCEYDDSLPQLCTKMKVGEVSEKMICKSTPRLMLANIT
jgi:hypothetical protein